MKLIRSILIFSLLATPLFAQGAAETWNIDKSHSSAAFKIRHMMSNVSGNFRDFDANLQLDRADMAKSSIDFTIQATSIDTANKNRDDHLRSADFFEVEKFPTITFKSKSIKAVSKTEYEVTGDFTMHGVTKTITLPVTFLGIAKGGRGEVAGFETEATINRKDYNVVWNRNLDEGGVLLGDDVKVSFSLEFRKPAPPAPAPAK